MDELPIGRRVAYWRGRRKMSQQVFADRLGKSKSWVDKVERGVRRLDKFSVVYEIADVLQIDVQLLLGKDVERRPETQNCIDQVEVEEIRAALERYDQMSAFFHAVPVAAAADRDAQGGQPRLADLPARQVRRPGPRAAQAAARRPGGGQRPRQRRRGPRRGPPARAGLPDRLVGAAQARRARAVLAGRRPLDRGLPARRRPAARRAWPRYRVGMALLALGRARPALEVNVNIANRLAPGDARGGHPGTALRLRHAAAQRRDGRGPDRRQRHRARPGRAAPSRRPRALGGDYNHYWTSLRPDQRASCTGPRPRSSWATGGRRSRPTTRIDPEQLRRAAAGAARPPLPRHRPRLHADRRRGEGQRDAAGGRPARPVGDPLPAARPRGASPTCCAAPGARRRRRSRSWPSRWESAYEVGSAGDEHQDLARRAVRARVRLADRPRRRRPRRPGPAGRLGRLRGHHAGRAQVRRRRAPCRPRPGTPYAATTRTPATPTCCRRPTR